MKRVIVETPSGRVRFETRGILLGEHFFYGRQSSTVRLDTGVVVTVNSKRVREDEVFEFEAIAKCIIGGCIAAIGILIIGLILWGFFSLIGFAIGRFF
jgi:hypothetical protein